MDTKFAEDTKKEIKLFLKNYKEKNYEEDEKLLIRLFSICRICYGQGQIDTYKELGYGTKKL